MPSLLFVCTANLYRSPLAAASFSRKLRSNGQAERWTVESAGTWATPGQHVPSDLLIAAKSMDIDLQAHVTRQVDEALLARFDLVLVMERGHREALRIEFPSFQGKIHLLSEVADGLEYDIADPVRSALVAGEFANQMCRLIDRGYVNICQLAQASQPPKPGMSHHVNYTL
jgi:protein-tyrosine-phosphatase